MATVNLGRIKPVFRGAYNNSTAYVIDDIVTYQDETYIAITATTGNLPTVTSNWTKLAAKGTDGTDVSTTLTTQGDILYRDGSGLARLGAGTSGEFLKTQGTGANPVWATADSGKTLGITQFTNSTRQSGVTQTGNRTVLWQVGTFTKQKANSKLKIDLVLPGCGAASNYPHFATDFIRFSTTNYDTNGSDIFGYIHNTRVDNLTFGANLIGHFLHDTTSTNISGTGTIYITLGYHSGNNSAVHPFAVWNPNTSEDNRSRQSVSYVVITELDL